MKATETYGFPYPECAPPLVKDASQISQMAQLAMAIDAEVERIDQLAEDNLTLLAAIRVLSPLTATTDVQVMPTFTFTEQLFIQNWATTGTQDGGILIPESAWWMIGSHASTDSATVMQVRTRLTVNGSAASSWGNPGSPYSGIFQLPALGMAPLHLTAGNVLNMEMRHNAVAGTAWNYRAHLWAVKLVTV